MRDFPGKSIDICILTEQRYVDNDSADPYVQNILNEDMLVRTELEKGGLRVERRSWDDPHADWSQTAFILFRSTWDYFERFPEFSAWLARVEKQTRMINSYEIVKWNLDKHYLAELSDAGINIPPTRFIEKGESGSLLQKLEESDWKEIILKPVVSGAARHTYRFLPEDSGRYEPLYQRLIGEEAMMIQEFQEQVILQGEVAFMLFDGQFSHAILKKARAGDFRVQDDFGGSLHPYEPGPEEIRFAEDVVRRSGRDPIYARVDVIRDNSGKLALTELELIEPELWFRFHPPAAVKLAAAIFNRYFKKVSSC